MLTFFSSKGLHFDLLPSAHPLGGSVQIHWRGNAIKPARHACRSCVEFVPENLNH